MSRRGTDIEEKVPVRRVVIGLLVMVVGLLLMTGLLPFTNTTVGVVAIVIGLGLLS